MVAALSELPGIKKENIDVNLERDAFTIEYETDLVSLDDMYAAILELGYRPGINEPDAAESEQSQSASVPEPIASALTEGIDSGRHIFIDFYAEWCAACKVLEESTLNESVVQQALESYVVLKVDTDEYELATSFFKVVGMPTLLVVNSKGEEIYRSVGFVKPEELTQRLKQLIVE